MKVRYHIQPRTKIKGSFILELTQEGQPKIDKNDQTELSFLSLRTKVASFLEEEEKNCKLLPFKDKEDSFCILPKADKAIINRYYNAKGCGSLEYLEEIFEQNEDGSFKDEELERQVQELLATSGEFSNLNKRQLGEQIKFGFTFDSDFSMPINAMDGFLPHEQSMENSAYSYDELEPKTLEEDEYIPEVVVSLSQVKKEAPSDTGKKAPSDKKQLYKRPGPVAEDGMLYGKRFSGDPIAIGDANDTMRNIVFEGTISGLEKKVFNSTLIIGSIVDHTNSIKFKMFYKKEEDADQFLSKVKNGMAVRTMGNLEFDNFERDYVLYLQGILELPKASKRTENRDDSRVELHLHTKMSDKDGLVTVKDLISTIKDWGHPAVAITDHGVVQAFPEAQAIAAEKGVKIIYGVEAYLVETEQDDKRNHIILLAKNMEGLRNLYRLITLSHLNYYKRRPRLPRQVIQEHREGLIVASACEAGELIRAIVNGKPWEELLEIAKFYDYLEIQPIGNNRFLIKKDNNNINTEEDLLNINRTVVKLGEALNLPVVATCDVHYLNPEDKIYREILLTAVGFTDAKEQPDLYLRTTDEMLEEFAYLGEEKAYEVVVTNSRMINDSIDAIKPVPDGTYSPAIEGAEEALRTMCYEKAERIYGKPLPQVVLERLEYELQSIIGHGFGVLYYIAHKLVKKSLDDGYLVGSRGSVGSSFVATMADITEVNPLPPHYVCPSCKYSEFITDGSYAGGFDLPRKKCPSCGADLTTDGHDIPFAIFMGFDGDKVPDIDLNFSGEYQPKAHKYTEELFGRDNVFRAGTIGTIADKTAMGYVRKYASVNNRQCRQGFYEELAKGFTKVKNTTGQHPGGIMVCPRDMDVHHFTPVQYPANKKESGIITTHFDYHSIEGRMTKLDILGHDDPTIIKMLEDLTGVDARTIPFDDPETLSLFYSTKAIGLTPEDLMGDEVASLGVPECGTGFVRQMLMDSRPKTFSELVRISGFSHGTNVWLDNAQDLIKNGTCSLSEAISTRDDIMNYLIQRGIDRLTAFMIMENVRKGKGIEKRNKQGEATTNYIDTLREGKIPEWFIESCLKISYLFPKAHAVAYVMMAFRIAWFKINHPLAFYAAYFSIRAKAFECNIMLKGLEAMRAEYKRIEALGYAADPKDKDLKTSLEVSMEMALRGYEFGDISLDHSQAQRFIIMDGKLIPPFVSVAGLGDKAADLIVEERNKSPFLSRTDLQQRAKLSQAIMDTLAELKVTDHLQEENQMSLFGF